MLCDNCGKREANVKYSENINGNKKELNLCEECSERLGINNIHFDIPIEFSSFFSGFVEDIFEPEIIPIINSKKELQCEKCGYRFKDIINTGEIGCANCYEVFKDRLDPIIKNIQGSNKHIGRIGKIKENVIIDKGDIKKGKNKYEENKNEEKIMKIEELNRKLKQSIKEERYEDAAKIRDEIKEIEKQVENE